MAGSPTGPSATCSALTSSRLELSWWNSKLRASSSRTLTVRAVDLASGGCRGRLSLSPKQGDAGPQLNQEMATDLMSDARRLVDKLWSYCNVLRDDGVGTIEYTEQLTYLLFLKMAHERATRKLRPERIVPDNLSWQRLLDADGVQLEVEYTRILLGLAR